jgi:hypothetical protein
MEEATESILIPDLQHVAEPGDLADPPASDLGPVADHITGRLDQLADLARSFIGAFPALEELHVIPTPISPVRPGRAGLFRLGQQTTV